MLLVAAEAKEEATETLLGTKGKLLLSADCDVCLVQNRTGQQSLKCLHLQKLQRSKNKQSTDGCSTLVLLVVGWIGLDGNLWVVITDKYRAMNGGKKANT